MKTNAKKIKVFFGTQMAMAIAKMPQYKLYWSRKFRYEAVAMAMTLKW